MWTEVYLWSFSESTTLLVGDSASDLLNGELLEHGSAMTKLQGVQRNLQSVFPVTEWPHYSTEHRRYLSFQNAKYFSSSKLNPRLSLLG